MKYLAFIMITSTSTWLGCSTGQESARTFSAGGGENTNATLYKEAKVESEKMETLEDSFDLTVTFDGSGAKSYRLLAPEISVVTADNSKVEKSTYDGSSVYELTGIQFKISGHYLEDRPLSSDGGDSTQTEGDSTETSLVEDTEKNLAELTKLALENGKECQSPAVSPVVSEMRIVCEIPSASSTEDNSDQNQDDEENPEDSEQESEDEEDQTEVPPQGESQDP